MAIANLRICRADLIRLQRKDAFAAIVDPFMGSALLIAGDRIFSLRQGEPECCADLRPDKWHGELGRCSSPVSAALNLDNFPA